MAKRRDEAFINELMDTSLYSMGAYFSDEHPELVDEVIAQSVAIEENGLRRYADQNSIKLSATFLSPARAIAVSTASSHVRVVRAVVPARRVPDA